MSLVVRSFQQRCLAWASLLLFCFSFLVLGQPPLPKMPSGNITLAWDWPTDLLAPFLATNSTDGNITTISSPTIFYLYESTDLTNWLKIVSVTNVTTISTQIQPVGARYLAVTASNFWGETSFSKLLWLPPLPTPATNLTVQRVN